MSLRQRTTGAAKDEPAAPANAAVAKSTAVMDTTKGHLGITLSTSIVTTGAKVDHVHPADLAAKAGLKIGDVITEVQGAAVFTHEDALERMTSTEGELNVTYLTEEAAKVQGDLEWIDTKRSIKKCFLWSGLVIGLIACAVAASGFQPTVWLNKIAESRPANPQEEMMRQAATIKSKMAETGDPASAVMAGMGDMIGNMREQIYKHNPELAKKLYENGGTGVSGLDTLTKAAESVDSAIPEGGISLESTADPTAEHDEV